MSRWTPSSSSAADPHDDHDARDFIILIQDYTDNSTYPTEIAHCLDHNPRLLACRGAYGTNPLHHAQIRSVAELLHNANPSWIDTKHATGNLPIHTVMRSASLSVVEFLVHLRPSHLHAHGREGRTPLHWACGNLRHEIVKYLVTQDSTTLDALDDGGKTALHIVAASRNPREDATVALAQWILQERPNMRETKDQNGETPLDVALRRDKPKLAALLPGGPQG